MKTLFDKTEKAFVNKYSKEMADKRTSDINLNLSIVGGKSVGKSALTVRFLTRRFIGEYDSNADLCINRHISIIDKDVNLHLKDTTGSDWVKGPSALIGWSTCIVIVYSITDRRSYDLVKLIFDELKLSERIDATCVLLLANKNDLEYLREVSHTEGESLAEKYGTKFYETSASTDCIGVCSAFRNLLCGAANIQTSKNNLNNRDETTHKKPIFIRRDSPIHRSVRFLTKSPSMESRQSADSTTSTISSSTSDDELYDMRPTVTIPCETTVKPIVTKKRKISLPTFMTRTVHTQKYFNFNKVR